MELGKGIGRGGIRSVEGGGVDGLGWRFFREAERGGIIFGF